MLTLITLVLSVAILAKLTTPTSIVRPKSYNPPKKSLPVGTYIIEAYCYGKDKKLYYITLNYASWDEACKARNEMAAKESLTIEYNKNIYQYSVLSTKISRVGDNSGNF